MKNLCTLLAAVVMIGCASDKSLPQAAGKTEALRVGMTKQEVLDAEINNSCGCFAFTIPTMPICSGARTLAR